MPNMRIGYLPQEPQLAPDKTVRETVEEGLGEIFDAKQKLEEIYAAYAEPDADFDKLAAEQARYEASSPRPAPTPTCRWKSLPTHCASHRGTRRSAKLSGGEKRRVALCRLLLSKPDMLLLDEPTNHLDAESVEWLEQFLLRFPGTVMAVTHDRYFLDNAAEWILELDRGHGIPWKGNYSSWLEQKEQRLEIEAKQESARIKAMQHELEWVRTNPKGRQAKSKARIARFEELSSHEHQKRNETQEIFIPVAERLGNQVIEFHGVSKGYGERLLIDDLSFSVPPGAIVGIIGPNGAGKSTLFRMITGAEKPDKGKIVIGSTAKLAVVDQSREALPDDKTAWEAISGGLDILTVGRFEMPSRAYLGRFNFKGVDQQKIVGSVSGGERGRLHLAITLLQGRQRAAARRAVERSRCRDVARARRRAARVRRQRSGHFARSLVSRSHRDAHPRLRRRFAGHVLRRQLPGIRGRQEKAPRRRRRAPASVTVQGADELSVRRALKRGRCAVGESHQFAHAVGPCSWPMQLAQSPRRLPSL